MEMSLHVINDGYYSRWCIENSLRTLAMSLETDCLNDEMFTVSTEIHMSICNKKRKISFN